MDSSIESGGYYMESASVLLVLHVAVHDQVCHTLGNHISQVLLLMIYPNPPRPTPRGYTIVIFYA